MYLFPSYDHVSDLNLVSAYLFLSPLYAWQLLFYHQSSELLIDCLILEYGLVSFCYMFQAEHYNDSINTNMCNILLGVIYSILLDKKREGILLYMYALQGKYI